MMAIPLARGKGTASLGRDRGGSWLDSEATITAQQR
jgi:hypothetical protein